MKALPLRSALAPVMLILMATTAAAFDKPKSYLSQTPPAIAPAAADICDLVRLDPQGIFWIRLHLRVNDRPYSERFDRSINRLFEFLDVDRDGMLSAGEAARAPGEAVMRTSLQNVNYFLQSFAAMPMTSLDANADGRVTPSEFAACYRKLNPPKVRLMPGYAPDPYAAFTSREVFRLLDRDRNGRLSRSEVSDAERLLEKSDFDDDELLSLQELIPNLQYQGQIQQGQRTQVDTAQFAVILHCETPAGFAQRLLGIYDADKDYHLTPAELRRDRAFIRSSDTDADGKLDVPELTGMVQRGQPDLEAWLSLDDGVLAKLERFEFRHGLASKSTKPGVAQAETPRGELALGDPPYAVQNANRFPQQISREQITRIFNQVAGSKGHVAEADLKGNPGAAMRGVLAMGDRNGDGKLTLNEYIAFVDLQFQLADAPIGLTMLQAGNNWFVALDANRDGRLSRPELRNAWSALRAVQPSDGDEIGPPVKGELVHVVVHRGQFVSFAIPQLVNVPQVTRPTKGPLWYRKMDRNGDGYVSRREFLGGRDDFARIDRNNDGLIDPQEAEAESNRR